MFFFFSFLLLFVKDFNTPVTRFSGGIGMEMEMEKEIVKIKQDFEKYLENRKEKTIEDTLLNFAEKYGYKETGKFIYMSNGYVCIRLTKKSFEYVLPLCYNGKDFFILI